MYPRYGMLQFLIVRSGTTEFDRQGRVLGNLDVPLHADATRELEEIVDRLRGTAIDAVYAGPGQSALETAERVCEPLEMKFKSLESLQNINLGLWQGLLLEEVKRKQPKVFRQWQENPETICPPEGEMLQAARDRIDFFLNKVYKKHKSGRYQSDAERWRHTGAAYLVRPHKCFLTANPTNWRTLWLERTDYGDLPLGRKSYDEAGRHFDCQ